jgi:hypothetical protein
VAGDHGQAGLQVAVSDAQAGTAEAGGLEPEQNFTVLRGIEVQIHDLVRGADPTDDGGLRAHLMLLNPGVVVSPRGRREIKTSSRRRPCPTLVQPEWRSLPRDILGHAAVQRHGADQLLPEGIAEFLQVQHVQWREPD